MNVMLKPAGSELVLTRELKAPRERVFAAWTDGAQAASWWMPRDFTLLACEMDVRPGGLWRHVMRTPDGTDYAMTYVFVEVVKPERISWRSVDASEGGSGHPSPLNVVTFEEHGGKTKWTLVAHFASVAERDRATKIGFAATIAEGAERLERVARSLT